MDVTIDCDGPLTGNATADVVIVGTGIAGLSTAYELAGLGQQVILIDRGAIGGGMTARTTAHLASALDDYYSELAALHGEDAARRYYESKARAIHRTEAICRAHTADAPFTPTHGSLFSPRP